ncbi:hypothetical protein LUZ60_016324 [Juncus effusus]|nr:hypothetical protein LUZ60_016324 [Juncus effusus]
MDSTRISNSDEESSYSYTTVSMAPPKRKAGRTKFRETRHPVYKGVRMRNSNRWVCEVREPNKKSRIWLGTFQTAEMAARAHDVAAMALRGKSACLNFADSPQKLKVPESTSRREIQRAAVEAAEMFRPKEGVVEEEGTVEILREEARVDPFCDGFELGERDYMDMARGMLIDPPPPSEELVVEEEESDGEMLLWSFSV